MTNWLKDRDAGLQQLEETTHIPDWIRGMEFCHIGTDDETGWLCGGYGTGSTPLLLTCSEYNDEAICPDCGKPTCPRCAQLEALQTNLEDS